MIIKKNRRAGTGRRGTAVDYVIGNRDRYKNPRPVKPQILRGEPALTKALIRRSSAKKWVFQSLIIGWGPTDRPERSEMEQVLRTFQEIIFPGLDKGRYYMLVVLHDGPKPHLHCIIPSVDLRRGYTLTPTQYICFSKVVRSFQRVLNLAFGWKQPDGWVVGNDGSVWTSRDSDGYLLKPTPDVFGKCWMDVESSLGPFVDWVRKRYHVEEEELERWKKRLKLVRYMLADLARDRMVVHYRCARLAPPLKRYDKPAEALDRPVTTKTEVNPSRNLLRGTGTRREDRTGHSGDQLRQHRLDAGQSPTTNRVFRDRGRSTKKIDDLDLGF
ncbi:MAG: hypothetical protein KatS3mg042_0610 [Rhodothermaceae bacterium]|nr:MAG: hypothetical protein KatS3mg042_0610 [Rhodothermaceae bacterium]